MLKTLWGDDTGKCSCVLSDVIFNKYIITKSVRLLLHYCTGNPALKKKKDLTAEKSCN